MAAPTMSATVGAVLKIRSLKTPGLIARSQFWLNHEGPRQNREEPPSFATRGDNSSRKVK